MRRIDLPCCLAETAAELRLIAVCFFLSFKGPRLESPSPCSPALPHLRPNCERATLRACSGELAGADSANHEPTRAARLPCGQTQMDLPNNAP